MSRTEPHAIDCEFRRRGRDCTCDTHPGPVLTSGGPGESGDSAETAAGTPDNAETSADNATTPADNGDLEVPVTAEPRALAVANAPTRRIYDWPAIKRRYVEGVKVDDRVDWPSLDAVAEHFGVVPSRVRETAAAERWREQRTQWKAQVEATHRAAKAAAMARSATEIDGKALDAAKLGLQLVHFRLTEIGQAAQRARSAAGVGGVTAATVDALEQQRLAAAADLWHKVGLRAVGVQEVQRHEITGANGQPVEVTHELRRDNPDRLAGVLSVLGAAGLGDLFGVREPVTVDAEVVSDDGESR